MTPNLVLEMQKCRPRVVSFLTGRGLDLGCGPTKVVESAIGIDYASGTEYDGKVYRFKPDMQLDLSAPNALEIFQSGSMDYVFSSHCMEDIHGWQSVFAEWWRVVKPGGHMVLYGPDPEYYTGSNDAHAVDISIEDVVAEAESFGNAKIVSATRHNEESPFGPEYSWQFIAQKTFDIATRAIEPREPSKYCPIAFPRQKKTDKECLLIRYGALGDAVWVTPLLKKLKEDGYYIVYNTTSYSAQVLHDNPNIDEFLLQDTDAIPNEELGPYWDMIGESFDKVINLSESIEVSLLKTEGTPEFNKSKKDLHKECNVNYMDRTMEIGGYDIKGLSPELHFTEREEFITRNFKEKYKDVFLIQWCLSGSSFHKVYPWAEYVAGELAKKHDDIRIITVGDRMSKIIEWNLPNTTCKSGMFEVRQSMLLTKYADCVIGPETGIMNAASCYDTPKIVFLSHSSYENLPKYWKNTTALRPSQCECFPCHKLIYTNCCPKGESGIAAKCAENIDPDRVYSAILKYYNAWKESK